MLNIVKYRNIPFFISGVMLLLSVFALVKFGLKPGIDFTGGSLLEVKFTQRPTIIEIQEVVKEVGIDNATVQHSGDAGAIIRMRFVTETEHQSILSKLREKFGGNELSVENTTTIEKDTTVKNDAVVSGNKITLVDSDTKKSDAKVNFELPKTQETSEVETASVVKDTSPAVMEIGFETIGAAVSSTLRDRSMYTAIAVIIATILYIAYSFRRVSKPVQSWKYGVAAIIAMLQNVIIVMGFFAVLGYYRNLDVGIPFVVAIITIIGYSVNDTIVVFDRIRENLIKRGSDNFSETVNKAINETLARSINTSLTILLVLIALYLFGGESIRYFSLALVMGIAISIYSSIFLTSPFLVVMQKWARK